MGALGVVGGFYCGWFFPDPWVGQLVTAICSFLCLGTIYVNAGLLIGIFFFLISYPWGGMHSDLGHLIANEKLIGELMGVVVAVVPEALNVSLTDDTLSVDLSDGRSISAPIAYYPRLFHSNEQERNN